MTYYKPKDIAKELNISTSALRHYEAWGVVPAPERSENGYRLYTGLHLAYFRCLRAMTPGFGYKVTYEVLRYIQQGELDQALWLVSAEQAGLQEEKKMADQTLALLQAPDLTLFKGKTIPAKMTIGEVAALTHVETSAIRHWEREGLLLPQRDPDNGYRIYTPVHVRQILLIRTLRRTVYYLERMRDIVEAVQHYNIEQAKQVTENALISIHLCNRQQYNGVRELMELCSVVELL
ncbi:MerR family transcriptional regulator [Paenibacillus albidus]|uniref:MerR family transcriptional regulator n=1 Tax=Paenibacillus albidus TaxID=2041023 RepID=UPI001BEA96E5|nr:MerR family transcriptional regulator [Paenibacillus albidus]MBT2291420.1 MerR family transcriptional regulator [Paenibacillus albidus]